MPELPDVENYRRYLARHGLSKTIRGVVVSTPRVVEGFSANELRRRLKGRRLVRARRHGKHLLAALDDGSWLAFHFGMTGRLVYFADGEQAPPYDRLRLDFGGGKHLAYVNKRLLGRVRLVGDDADFLRARELGPDALAVDEASFIEGLRGRRGSIKSALMDQGLFAGIGNVYSDEILYHARLHPALAAGDLDQRALRRLHRALRRVLETAVEKGAGAEDVERRVPRTWLLPHRKKGAACKRCGTGIATLKTQGRTAYFCPGCQPSS